MLMGDFGYQSLHSKKKGKGMGWDQVTLLYQSIWLCDKKH